MLLSNKTYDTLKKIVQIVLPGLATLYAALAQYWDLPNVTEIVGSITAFSVFLGVILGMSSKTYNNSDDKYDGALALEEREDGTIIRLQQVDQNALFEKDEVVLKLNR